MKMKIISAALGVLLLSGCSTTPLSVGSESSEASHLYSFDVEVKSSFSLNGEDEYKLINSNAFSIEENLFIDGAVPVRFSSSRGVNVDLTSTEKEMIQEKSDYVIDDSEYHIQIQSIPNDDGGKAIGVSVEYDFKSILHVDQVKLDSGAEFHLPVIREIQGSSSLNLPKSDGQRVIVASDDSVRLSIIKLQN